MHQKSVGKNGQKLKKAPINEAFSELLCFENYQSLLLALDLLISLLIFDLMVPISALMAA